MIGAAATLALIGGLAIARSRLGGLATCASERSVQAPYPACMTLFAARVGWAKDWLVAASVAPVVLGALVAAPLMTREYEQRTYSLIAVSSVSRTRWWWIQAMALIVTSTLAATLIALTAVPVRHQLAGTHDGFGVGGSWNWIVWSSGWLLVPYTVSAVAVGLLAGALLRRTLPAILVTVLLVTAMRAGAFLVLRPHWLQPARAESTDLNTVARAPAGALILDPNEVLVGRRLAHFPPACVRSLEYMPTQDEFDRCLTDRGVTALVTTYQPADRAGLFACAEGLALLLLSAAMIGSAGRLSSREQLC